MKLFFYEFKKSILKPSVFIVILVFSIVNVYKLYEMRNNETFMNQNGSNEFDNAYIEKIYPQIKGEMTQESIDFIIAEINRLEKLVGEGMYNTDSLSPNTYTGYVYGDYNLLNDTVSDQFVYAYTYTNTIGDMYEQAKDNIAFFENVGNEYQLSRNERIKTLFFGREITELKNVQNAIHIFDYRFSSLIILLLVIFVLSPAFSQEHSNGMNRLIKSAGRKATIFHAKHRMSLIFIILITAWFCFLDTLTLGILYRIDGWQSPIYTIMIYQYSPVNISIIGAVFISFLMKLCFFLLFSQLVMFISAISKNMAVSFVLSMLLVLCVVFFSDFNILQNPVTLLKPNLFLVMFSYINIGGMAFASLPLSIISCLCLSGIVYICNRIRSHYA